MSEGQEYDFTYGDENDKSDGIVIDENTKPLPTCHKCKSTNVLMIQCANEEGNSCMTCMKCLFHMIIETGTEQFCKDNKEFEGMLFGYKDKFKV